MSIQMDSPIMIRAPVIILLTTMLAGQLTTAYWSSEERTTPETSRSKYHSSTVCDPFSPFTVHYAMCPVKENVQNLARQLLFGLTNSIDDSTDSTNSILEKIRDLSDEIGAGSNRASGTSNAMTVIIDQFANIEMTIREAADVIVLDARNSGIPSIVAKVNDRVKSINLAVTTLLNTNFHNNLGSKQLAVSLFHYFQRASFANNFLNTINKILQPGTSGFTKIVQQFSTIPADSDERHREIVKLNFQIESAMRIIDMLKTGKKGVKLSDEEFSAAVDDLRTIIAESNVQVERIQNLEVEMNEIFFASRVLTWHGILQMSAINEILKMIENGTFSDEIEIEESIGRFIPVKDIASIDPFGYGRIINIDAHLIIAGCNAMLLLDSQNPLVLRNAINKFNTAVKKVTDLINEANDGLFELVNEGIDDVVNAWLMQTEINLIRSAINSIIDEINANIGPILNLFIERTKPVPELLITFWGY